MRVLLAWAATAAAAIALAGCGASDVDQVNTTLGQFAHAVATRNAAPICDHVLAPGLVARIENVGLSCEYAIERFFFSCKVKDPTLTVGRVSVDNNRAKALVFAAARGQPGGIFELGLVKTSQGWRVASESAEKGSRNNSCV
jgi:hypothetical protein